MTTLGRTNAAGNRYITRSETQAWVNNTKPRPSKAQIIETLTGIYPKVYAAETAPPLCTVNEIAYYAFGWVFTRKEMVERYDLQEEHSKSWLRLQDEALPDRRIQNDPEVDDDLVVFYFATLGCGNHLRMRR